MVSFSSLAVALATAITVCALPHSQPEEILNSLLPRQSSNMTGFHDGWFYKYWSDGLGPHNYTNLPGGRYSTSWSYGGNFYAGKGWQKGSINRKIRYNGTYTPNGNSYLGVYGFMKQPTIEYLILDNFGSYNPGSVGVYKGTLTTDGGTYGISVRRISQADGPDTFQYWSVRYQKRVGGTISIGNHFKAFEAYGMPLGLVQDYQILFTDGYYSSGKSDITVYRT